MIVSWSELAIADRNRIFEYIDSENPSAAIRVDDCIRAAIFGLDQFPEKGRPGRIEGTRELVLVGTPYIAAYIIQGNAVRILRIYHGAQKWPQNMAEAASTSK